MAVNLILHHYPGSPFSQKALLALALKKIPFKSFIVEPVPGRATTHALVGGYRRIPVLQNGANVYCDTHEILEALEEMFPNSQPLSNKSNKATIYAYKMWGDKILGPLSLSFIPWNSLPKEIKEDREKSLGMTFDTTKLDAAKPLVIEQITTQLAVLEESLSDGRKFILGDTPTHADIHMYRPLWSLKRYTASALESGGFGSIPNILSWYTRIIDLAGPSVLKTLETAQITKEEVITEALKASATLEPIPQAQGSSLLGHRVSITPDDTFKTSTEGVVVKIDEGRVVLRRSGELNGQKVITNVHFPKSGFVIKREL